MNVKWKPFNPDKRRKWYFLEDELVHIEHLHSRIVFGKLPRNISVYKAIKKKNRELLYVLFDLALDDMIK